jgi:CTP synthase
MLKEGLDKTVMGKLKLTSKEEPNLDKWKEFLGKLKNPLHEVTVGLIGKYVELQDAYKSIHEAFIHSGTTNECKVKVVSIQSETITPENVAQLLGPLNGILVAPGFGIRGVEGKIAAIKYARENNLPFFGICLGMQCSVIEFARNVMGWQQAHSTEMNPDTDYPVIDIMESQKKVNQKGGTMRLGAYQCQIKKNTKAYQIYNSTLIYERHRHRWEMNNKYLDLFEENGLMATGTNPDTGLVEIVEHKKHPFFIGVQYHPELKSTVDNPHPLFVKFIKAAMDYRKKRETESIGIS